MCWVSSKVITKIISTESLQLDAQFRCLFKSTTLDDLECHYALLFRNSCFFQRPPWIFEQRYPHHCWRKYRRANNYGGRSRPIIRISREFRRDRASNDNGAIEMTNLCSTVTRYLSRIFTVTGKANNSNLRLMMSANFEHKTTAASPGFLVTARLSCCWMLSVDIVTCTRTENMSAIHMVEQGPT